MNLTPLSHFHNLHQGKQGFVCGSGSSLLNTPTNLPERGITICVNASGMRFSRFDYLYITDPAVITMAYWDEVYKKADNIIYANPDLEPYFIAHQDAYLKLDAAGGGKNHYLLTRNYNARENYNFNSDTLFFGNDASVSALHLAVVLGLTPVTLCGIDLCHNNSNGNRYFDARAFDHADDSPYKDSFAKEYPTGYRTVPYKTDIWLEIALPCWQKVYQQNDCSFIFNASDISKLPGFKKVNLNTQI